MIQKKEINIDGINYEYAKGGKGKPVIFLPGLGTPYSVWENVLPIVAKKYEVYSIRLPIYGSKSQSGITYDLNNIHAFLKSFINKNDIQKPSLVGQSLGGITALSYVANNKGAAKSLVIVGAPLANGKQKPPLVWKIVVRLILKSNNPKKYSNFVIRNENLIKTLYKLITSESNFPDMKRGLTESPIESIALCVQDLFSASFENEIVRVNVPTLVVYGKNDKLIKPLNGTRLYKKIPNAKIVAVEDNHFIPTNSPKMLSGIILKFLNQLS